MTRSVHKFIIRTLWAAVASSMLSACTGIVVYEFPGPQRSYFDGDFEYATHKGAILTEVHGNPFPMPADRFRDLVLAHMKNAPSGPPVSFVARPSREILLGYKVVAVFNAAPNSDSDGMCANGAAEPRTGPGASVRMDLVFCLGDEVKTEVAGKITSIKGVQDPLFREFVRRVTHAIIPVGDNEDQGEGDVNVP